MTAKVIHITVTLTPCLLEVLDTVDEGNRSAFIEKVLRSSRTIRNAAQQRGIELTPRPAPGRRTGSKNGDAKDGKKKRTSY